MGKDYHKVKTVLNATIHSLTFGTNIMDPIQIEWKRGETKGFTDKAFVLSENTVSFEKSIKCPCTMFVGKKPTDKKPKLFQVTVNVFKDGTKKKVYGKLIIDVSEFYGIQSPLTKEYQVESAHKEPAFLRFSAILSENVNEPQQIDATTSIAEENLETDQPEEWDVSVAINEEDQNRINEFFNKRRETKEKLTVALSEFQKKVVGQPRPSPRRRMKAPSLQSGIQTTPPSSLDQFFSAPKSSKPKRRKLNEVKSQQFLTPPSLISSLDPYSGSVDDSSILDLHSSDEVLIDQISENLESPIYTPSLNDTSGIEEEAVNEVDLFEEASEFLKTIVMKHWMSSPVVPTKVPLSSAALFAGLMKSGIFDSQKFTDEQFTTLITDFNSRISKRNVVDKGTTFDNLCVMLSLLHLISSNTTIDQNRRDTLAKEFIETVVRPLFSKYIDEISMDLQTAAMSIVMGTVDNDSAIKLILDSLDNVLKKNFILDQTAAAIENQDGTILDVQKNFRDAVRQMLVDKFDVFFITNILQNDFQARFGNAANWNQIMQTIREEHNLDFTMFREAISILMVAQGLCQTPELIPDIAPTLSAELILKLMEIEVPDDLMPLPNDTDAFAEYYKLKRSRPVEEVITCVKKDYKGDFSEILTDLPNNWESSKFDDELVSQFPFLKIYFK